MTSVLTYMYTHTYSSISEALYEREQVSMVDIGVKNNSKSANKC